MHQTIVTYLPYLLSVISIYQIILAGNKAKHAWAVGLGNQTLWLTWIIVSVNYGFLPMNAAIWIVYTRNHLKWNR